MSMTDVALENQVRAALDDLRERPDLVGLTHAKILAAALKREMERTEEAVRLGQKFALAQRDLAANTFDAVFTDGTVSLSEESYFRARKVFREKIGAVP